jgi:hypothetical protein
VQLGEIEWVKLNAIEPNQLVDHGHISAKFMHDRQAITED